MIVQRENFFGQFTSFLHIIWKWCLHKSVLLCILVDSWCKLTCDPHKHPFLNNVFFFACVDARIHEYATENYVYISAGGH